MKHFLSVNDISGKETMKLIKKALKLKKNPYSQKMKNKTLLMVFEEPSVRTRISFEAGMTQMGGHAIYYHIKESTLGKKESLEDFAQNISRYVNILMVRAKDHKTLSVIAQNSSIPVINGMTNYSHPCQAMADLMTIYEKKKKLKGLKIAYFGDALNNITHSLIFAAAITGMNIAVACPHDEKYMPSREVLDKAGKIAAKTGSFIEVTNDVKKAAEGSDIIYTDSWMSYHVQESEKNLREKIFRPFQVNSGLISMAKKDAIFMHDQPATRGMEVTSKVMDSKNSVLFDQAENRLHIQKAIILKLSMEL